MKGGGAWDEGWCCKSQRQQELKIGKGGHGEKNLGVCSVVGVLMKGGQGQGWVLMSSHIYFLNTRVGLVGSLWVGFQPPETNTKLQNHSTKLRGLIWSVLQVQIILLTPNEQ